MEVFVNGQFLPLSQATVSVQDRGLLYGDGLFETIRAEAGEPLWLDRHLTRLAQSSAVLNLALPPEFPWKDRIKELLQRNSLITDAAAVKVLITRGENGTLGLPKTSRPTIIISARNYLPPPAEDYESGWPVVTFPERRLNYLSRHKTLNYLFCLAARQYAMDQGGREGLILSTDGSIAEGATTAIIWQEEKNFFTPGTDNALASVTVAVFRAALTRRGLGLSAATATEARLAASQGIWLANSLIGLLPISSLNGQSLAISTKTAGLNNMLWSEAL